MFLLCTVLGSVYEFVCNDVLSDSVFQDEGHCCDEYGDKHDGAVVAGVCHASLLDNIP